jgi:hypothetical protein
VSRKTKADIKQRMVKSANTKQAIKPKGIFDDITMSDILCGFGNKVGNKRAVKTNANGMRYTVNKLRFG